MYTLPEKIRIVLRPSEQITDDEGAVFQARPAFIQDVKTDSHTALAWGNALGGEGVQVLEGQANTPFSGLRFVSWEARGEGGRVHKVLIRGEHYVDLREESLMELLLGSLILDGHCKGQFIWGKVGSQMRLVLVGSPSYLKMVAGARRSSLKRIPRKDFEIGGVYRTKGGTTAVFLGWLRKRGGKKRGMAFKSLYGSQKPGDKSWQDQYNHYMANGPNHTCDLKLTHSFLEHAGAINVVPAVIKGFSQWKALDREWETVHTEIEMLDHLRAFLGKPKQMVAYLKWLPDPVPGIIEDYIREHRLDKIPRVVFPDTLHIQEVRYQHPVAHIPPLSNIDD